MSFFSIKTYFNHIFDQEFEISTLWWLPVPIKSFIILEK